MSYKPWKEGDPVPPLVELPVLQQQYCDQKTTDNALAYVWKNRPELIGKLAEYEDNFDQFYLKEMRRVVDFLVGHAVKEIKLPSNYLGWLDLVFEISRRLRVSLCLPEWPVQGRPLIDGAASVLSPLPSVPIHTMPGKNDYLGLTQEIADRVIDEAYRRVPSRFYELAENIRRGSVGANSISWVVYPDGMFKPIIEQIILPEEKSKGFNEHAIVSYIESELGHRVRNICQIN